MLRASVAVFAGLIVVAVLAMLTVASQSVNESYYADYAARVRAIESTRADIDAFLSSARAAFLDGREVPDAAGAALERLQRDNVLLQTPSDDELSPVANELATYDSALTQFLAGGISLTEQQDALAAAVRIVQEESPTLVKELRRFDLRAQSQSIFVLALDIIEFASGQSETDAQQLSQRLAAVADDERVIGRLPRLLEEFEQAASTVLTERQVVAESLNVLSETAAIPALAALSDAMAATNRTRVAQAERARLLLSISALVLLAGVGYVAYRLQASYRALNRTNAELATINDSLEERVNARTAELRAAYEELQESQVQLVQAEKMSSLGELVAGISHEINTPLWYLINNATIIDERLQTAGRFTDVANSMIESLAAGPDDTRKVLTMGLSEMRRMLVEGLKDDIDEASDLVKDSVEGLEELSELAQSLKDFSRLDRAQTGTFSVNDGLERTLLIARNKLKNRITVNKDLGEVPLVHCSPSQVNQVFLNLITNAADAIEGNGDITIKSWSNEDSVSVSIADTGCGIEPALMSKIRDPFFTTKEVGKGTGLGLSIVDRIVNAHDGEVEIESEVGRGTVVTVTFPTGRSATEGEDLLEELPSIEDGAGDRSDEFSENEAEEPPRVAAV